MHRTRPVAVALLLLVVVSGVALASPRGSPDLSVFVPDNRFGPGEEAELEVFILNGGSVELGGSEADVARVTTARGVSVSLREGRAPIEVRTAEKPVGNVPEGVTGPVAFSILVDEGAAPGTYHVPVRVEYRYTRHIVTSDPDNPDHQEIERVETTSLEIEIRRDARFEITGVSSDVRVGEGGTASLSIENVGSVAAREASIVVESDDDELTFGAGSSTAESFVGDWAPGETKRVAFDVGVAERVLARNYSITATVNYRDDDGALRTSDDLAAGVRVVSEPPFAVVEASTTAGVGGAGTLDLLLGNEGDAILRDATVRVRSADGDLRFGGSAAAESFVGDWAPGERTRVQYRISVAEDAILRDYALSVTATYEDEGGTERTTGAVVAAVRPRPEQTFSVVDVSPSVAVGEAGYVTFAIRNDGPRTIHESTVTLESESGVLGFGPEGTRAVSVTGDWAPGEIRRLRVRVEIAPDAVPRNYSVIASVAYENAEGVVQPPEALTTALRPAPEQSFALRDATGDLRVGTAGETTARIENTAPRTARDVVVILAEPWTNLTRTSEYAVGDLPPGGSAPVRFVIDVPPGLEPGPRQLAFGVRYRDTTGTVQRVDPLSVRVDVGAKREPLRVEPVNATFRVDSSGVLGVRVTNERGEPVTNVVATMTAADPLSSDDPEAYVARIDPGESADLVFHLDVSNDAIPKTHAVTVRLVYEDAAGNPREAGPYRVPVAVTATPGGSFPILAVVVMIVALGAGVYWWRRRR